MTGLSAGGLAVFTDARISLSVAKFSFLDFDYS
jgi:hypothetical protein